MGCINKDFSVKFYYLRKAIFWIYLVFVQMLNVMLSLNNIQTSSTCGGCYSTVQVTGLALMNYWSATRCFSKQWQAARKWVICYGKSYLKERSSIRKQTPDNFQTATIIKFCSCLLKFVLMLDRSSFVLDCKVHVKFFLGKFRQEWEKSKIKMRKC